MISTSKAEVNRMPMNAAGNPAMISSIALRNTWRYSTRCSLAPFARAVTTYCLRISSMKMFLVRIVSVAKPPTTSAVVGNTMCHR